MSYCECRPATLADHDRLVEFNLNLVQETEHRALDRQTVQAGVRAILTDPLKGRYFVAHRDEEVIGCLMITFEWSDWRNGQIWWVQSVYVTPSHRRQGVFRTLCEHANTLAQTDPEAVGLRLYVEHENQTAQTVYRQLGWQSAGYLVMERMFDAES